MDPATLAFALGAGAVAAVNPCGFALLPAYVSLAVTGATPGAVASQAPRSVAVARAVRFTLGMTVGFVLVFGLFALALGAAASAVIPVLPYVTIVMGVALVAVGGWLLAGRELGGLPRLQVPGLSRLAPGSGVAGNVAYGVTFALASLSCTIAPFLAVWTTALRTGFAGTVVSFVVYALGMGAVVGALALSVAFAQTQVAVGLRRAAPYLPRIAGTLVLLAGAYVLWYGVFELRIAADPTASDPVVEAAIAVQGWLTRTVTGLGAAGLAGAAVAVATLGGLAALLARRRRSGTEDPAATAGAAGAADASDGPAAAAGAAGAADGPAGAATGAEAADGPAGATAGPVESRTP